jgi:hypothetical protein
MKYAKCALLLLVASFLFGSISSSVYALDAVPTGDDYWLNDTELKVAAYARTADGTDLKFIEVFNDSDTLLDIVAWKITGVFSSGQRAELPVVQTKAGMLAPKAHVVVQVVSDVGGASYDSAVWSPAVTKGSLLVSLEITAKAAGWKTDVYSLKSSGSGATTKYDEFWVRSQISGESYTSTLSSFTATTPVVPHDDGLYEVPVAFPGKIVEVYPYSSECAPNDMSVLCGDFIKIRLDSPYTDVSRFVLRTDSSSSSRTTSNTFYLSDTAYDVTDEGYMTIAADGDGKRLSLTNSGGYIWLEDVYGMKLYDDTVTKYEAAGTDEQGYSWAIDSAGLWQWSTTPRPFGANTITVPIPDVVVCPAGKYLNPDTGRCRTLEEAVNALATCPEGQERNPITNRCRSKVTASAASLTPCGEGQERNPITNRCRSIASAVAELMPCDEGYERNPTTNRCRKVAGVSTTAGIGTEQAVETAKGGTWNVWTWALVGVAVSGAVGYGIYEWRHELSRFGQSIAARLGKK